MTLRVPFASVCLALAVTPLLAAPSYDIPRTSESIVVDGRLDEPMWAEALVVELAYETDPGENIEAPVRTECRLAYSATHLFYGCHAFDPEPEKIRAHYSDRDRALADDVVGIALDTFNDRNTAFILDVNPFGIQNDRIYLEAARRNDETWDAIWDSAGRLTEDGFVVEVAIPFSSLRFPRSTTTQRWGFNLRRYRTRDVQRRFALVPYDRNDPCHTCQQATLVGFEGIDPGRNLEITPTLTSVQTASRSDFPDGPLDRDDPDVEPGLTANWGITPNMALSATLNPDFSQVEADIAQLDINTEFALFFSERRPFFLEGSDYFATQLRAVHTRTLADPEWGLKLTGKEGKNAVGVFVVRDDRAGLLLPGPEFSGFTSLDGGSEAAVLRYRRDVGESSTLGALFTDRRAGGGYSNQVGGIDTRLRLSSNDNLDVQWLRSRTDYPLAVREVEGLGPGTLEDDALVARYQHRRRNWNVRGAYTDIGDEFRADLGFMPQVGYRQAVAGGGYEWFGDGDQWFTNIEVGGDWDRTETQDGALLEEEWEFVAGVNARREIFFYFGGGIRDRVFQGVPFDQQFGWTFFSVRPRSDFRYEIEIDRRDAIDIAGLRPGDQKAIYQSVEWKPGRHLRADLSHNYRALDVAGGRLFTADLTELRLVYQFNRRTFVRLIGQRTSVTRDPDLQAGVEPRIEDLFGQLLFSYKVNPQTALFLGYTSDHLDVGDTGLVETGNTLFLKLGYNWQP